MIKQKEIVRAVSSAPAITAKRERTPMTLANSIPRAAPRRGWTIGLWAAQLVLAGMFGMAGYMHAFLQPDAMVQMGIPWVADAPLWFVRFVGTAELAGVAGIILPALTRIAPVLTPVAALGFATIQLLAFFFHIFRGEFAVTPFNLVLLALSLFVAWGRLRKAPIATRS